MISIRLLRSGLALLLMWMAIPVSAQTDYERACEGLASNQLSDSERLQKLFKLNWDYTMHESPEFATDVGYSGLNDRWTDNSLEAIGRRNRELQAPLKVLKTIRRDKLNAVDQLNYDLFRRGVEEAIEGTQFHGEYLAINQMGGVQQDAAQVLENAPHRTVKDYEDMIARLDSLPTVIGQVVTLLQKGLETGITPPRITLRDVPEQIEKQMELDPQKNPLLKPFREFPLQIAEADRERLFAKAAAAVTNKDVRAFAKLREFLTSKYLPGARESIGMSELPNGRAWYAYNVRSQATTKLSPKEIHEIGLAEVKRIRAEMDKVIVRTGFKGSFEEFSKFVREDARFYYTNREDLLTGYRDIAKRVDPELPKLFGKLPRLTYGVRAIPEFSEKSQSSAYYQPGSVEAGRAGYFCANTYALDTRAKWEMEPLTFHEAVPGHHLQIALAQEMEGQPEFRKHGGYTAYVEGWALYSETLGEEMGFYKDPFAKYGQLTYEIWRAIRLVVDTGMHEFGWTRQQAIDCFKANTSKDEHEITVEVDRYIVWPGQALAYKIGQLKIRELRNFAQHELGEKFNVRAFHDQVLGNGALPLDVLEARIKSWVAEQKRKP